MQWVWQNLNLENPDFSRKIIIEELINQILSKWTLYKFMSYTIVIYLSSPKLVATKRIVESWNLKFSQGNVREFHIWYLVGTLNDQKKCYSQS